MKMGLLTSFLASGPKTTDEISEALMFGNVRTMLLNLTISGKLFYLGNERWELAPVYGVEVGRSALN